MTSWSAHRGIHSLPLQTRYNLIVVHDVSLEFIMALVKNQFLGSRLIFGLKLSLSERWSYNPLLLKREQFIALFVVTCWP